MTTTELPPCRCYQFTVIQCDTVQELERFGVYEFAAEFDHHPEGFPVLLFFCNGELAYYLEARQTTVFYPAIHPRISPRMFLTGGRQFADILVQKHQGALLATDPMLERFTPELMAKIRFRLPPYVFYEVQPNG